MLLYTRAIAHWPKLTTNASIRNEASLSKRGFMEMSCSTSSLISVECNKARRCNKNHNLIEIDLHIQHTANVIVPHTDVLHLVMTVHRILYRTLVLHMSCSQHHTLCYTSIQL